MILGLVKAAATAISQAVFDSTNAKVATSAATGSGLIIYAMVGSLQKEVEIVKKDLPAIESRANQYADAKYKDIQKDIQYIRESQERQEKTLNKLDGRIFKIKNTIEESW